MTIQDFNDTDRSKCVAWARELLFLREVEAIAMRCFTVAIVCACLGQLAVEQSWIYTATSWQEKDGDFSSQFITNTSEQSLNLVITVKATLLIMLLVIQEYRAME